jgi:hypothetical protein
LQLERLFGLSTGIGSLPHTTAAEALELVDTYFNQIPHWPQLPRRNKAEGFISQYLAPLIKREIVVFDAAGSPYFCTEHPQWEERCLQFYELLLNEDRPELLAEFAFPVESAAGFYTFIDECRPLPGAALCVKGQLSGPVTVGFQVTGENRTPSFYNPSLREIIVKTLAAQARWQTRCLQSRGLPALLFIDDPGIYSFGSSSAVGLGRAEIQAGLSEIIEAIAAEGGLSGVHCCAGTDWSLLLELPLDLVSFDAYGYFPSMQVYGEALERFLARGGALAWGIVPTNEDAFEQDPASLCRMLEQKMETLARQGVDQARLRRQFIITPACGAGTLSVELAERIYRLTAELTDESKGRFL